MDLEPTLESCLERGTHLQQVVCHTVASACPLALQVRRQPPISSAAVLQMPIARLRENNWAATLTYPSLKAGKPGKPNLTFSYDL